MSRAGALLSNLHDAEGAGEFAAADKARFYRFARRSATESAAIVDVPATLELTEESLKFRGRALLLRIVAMLTAIVLKLSGSGSLALSAPAGPCPAPSTSSESSSKLDLSVSVRAPGTSVPWARALKTLPSFCDLFDQSAAERTMSRHRSSLRE